MTVRLFALLALLSPGPAAADCVTPADLATGISFTRQDGRIGLVHGDADGVVVDYAFNIGTAWTDFHRTRLGIYDLTWGWTPTDAYYVGGGPGGVYDYKYPRTPPVPVPDTRFATTVRVTETQDDGTRHGVKKTRYAYDVTYSFQATKEVTLSGCPYTVLPVEATFTGPQGHYSRRWIYFPDLGFGLETRQTDHKTGEDRKLGLTAMTPKG